MWGFTLSHPRVNSKDRRVLRCEILKLDKREEEERVVKLNYLRSIIFSFFFTFSFFSHRFLIGFIIGLNSP